MRNNRQFEILADGNLLSVPGLRAGAVAAGIKESGSLDVAVVTAAHALTAVGMFTTNKLAAAPVQLCRRRLAAAPRARTIVINAGNANAMTGAQGDADARAMAERVESHCGGPALVLSTGVIGVPMPMDNVLAGIDGAAARLGPENGDDLATAMLTTDTTKKTTALRVWLPDSGRQVVVGGVAKGSGMIHPDMATMLALVATDAPLSGTIADAMLKEAVDRSFHQITVDGDTSTNDSVLLLARGPAGDAERVSPADLTVLREAVTRVCRWLAEAIVRDGEGATRVARVLVRGTAGSREAAAVARSIATSSLVKTALAGGDPNWGRILSAAANAGIALSMDRMRLWLGGIEVFRGHPLDVDSAAVDEAFSANEVSIELDLGAGDGSAEMLTTDLTKRYVEINSEYTT